MAGAKTKLTKHGVLIFAVAFIFVIAALFLTFLSWNTHTDISLPSGYTLDSYTVAKVTDVACTKDAECTTPGEYLMQSHCPFTSICLKNKCTVVCPHFGPK